MDLFQRFFDVNEIFFTLFGYSISYLEFIGTIFTLISVILVAKRKVLSWPIGIVGTVLFGILFFQINLYADFLEQIFYFITALWGWKMWSKTNEFDKKSDQVKVTTNSASNNLHWIAGIVVLSALLSFLLFNIHNWLPSVFPEPASLPVLDATTTVMSFAAQILLMKRKLESWLLWIAVDILAIGIFWYKGVVFVALLYVIFLINAVVAYIAWRKSMKTGSPTSTSKAKA